MKGSYSEFEGDRSPSECGEDVRDGVRQCKGQCDMYGALCWMAEKRGALEGKGCGDWRLETRNRDVSSCQRAGVDGWGTR